MKKQIWRIVSVLIIGTIAGLWTVTDSGNGIKSISNIKRISYTQTFEQKAEEYMVYFWQSDCHYCQSIEKNVLKFSNKVEYPVYIVDMAAKENQDAWYNWQAHHEKYDKVIGKQTEDGDMFNEGESVNKYMNDTKIKWRVGLNNQTHEIVAIHNTAYENKSPQTPETIEITGTPTMFKIQNGKLTKYANGTDDVLSLMKKEMHQK